MTQWKTVPIEPTPEMMNRARGHLDKRDLYAVWKAMVHAATHSSDKHNKNITYVCPVCNFSLIEDDTALLRQALEAFTATSSTHGSSDAVFALIDETIAALRVRLGVAE